MASEQDKKRKREWSKQDRAANPDKYRAKDRANYAKNREQRNAYAKAYKARNPDKVEKAKLVTREWREKNKEHVKDRALRRVYFTLAIRDALMQHQDNRCAICNCDLLTLHPNRVHADHCHSSKTPRGILCHVCNVGVGHFRDDPETLRRAAAYLENPPINQWRTANA